MPGLFENYSLQKRVMLAGDEDVPAELRRLSFKKLLKGCIRRSNPSSISMNLALIKSLLLSKEKMLMFAGRHPVQALFEQEKSGFRWRTIWIYSVINPGNSSCFYAMISLLPMRSQQRDKITCLLDTWDSTATSSWRHCTSGHLETYTEKMAWE